MNGITRKKFYTFLVKRDGEYCRGCGAFASQRSLVIDHKDNNSKNNDPSNLQFLCRPCNYKKNPRKPLDFVSENEGAADQTELEINRQREPLFRRYVAHIINELESFPEKDLINSGAEHVGISTITAKRYLDKMCSSLGLYQRKQIGKTIVIEYKNELILS